MAISVEADNSNVVGIEKELKLDLLVDLWILACSVAGGPECQSQGHGFCPRLKQNTFSLFASRCSFSVSCDCLSQQQT